MATQQKQQNQQAGAQRNSTKDVNSNTPGDFSSSQSKPQKDSKWSQADTQKPAMSNKQDRAMPKQVKPESPSRK